MQKGFAQILVIGIVVALMAVGIGDYLRVSKQPVGNEARKTGDAGYESETRRGVPESGGKNIPGTIPENARLPVREGKITSPDKLASQVSGDIVQGHPVNCNARLGFDNYRTEQTFVINPKNNREMYINVEYRGLYKSTNGGKVWSFAGSGLKGLPRNDNPTKPCHELRFHLYIDPSNPEHILAPGGGSPSKVGEGLGGFYESLDGGTSWRQLFTSEMSAYTESAVLDPTNSKIVYVTTAALSQGMDGPDKGKTFVTKGVVYKTVDGGKTWEELSTGLFKDLRVPGIFIDSRNPNMLRIATFGLPSGSNIDKKSTDEQWGFLETNDAGRTWAKLGATSGIGIRHVDVSPADLNHFFLMVSKDNVDKVYYSIDGTLKEASNMAVNFARYDPKDTTGMRLIGVNFYAQPNDVFESLDGGKSWNAVGKLPDGITSDHRVSNIVFDPIDKNVIYINSDLARVWKSVDKGATWEVLLNINKLGQ